MRITKDQMAMEIAHVARLRATCSRLSVGCVLTDSDRKLFSIGYNGGPRGGRNACARTEEGNCGCAHAEANAVAMASLGLTVAYVTTMPCELCAVLLVNYGIEELHYDQDYRLAHGRAVLANAGVKIVRTPGASS